MLRFHGEIEKLIDRIVVRDDATRSQWNHIHWSKGFVKACNTRKNGFSFLKCEEINPLNFVLRLLIHRHFTATSSINRSQKNIAYRNYSDPMRLYEMVRLKPL